MNSDQKNILKQLAQMGEVVYIKKDGSRFFLNEEGVVPLKTQADAVLYFLQRLDMNMLKLLLKEATYQDMDKRIFLRKLTYALETFIENGDTYLNVYPGKCISTECNNASCLGYSFIGNKSANYMDLIFDVKVDLVKDIYECFHLSTDDDNINRKKQILIDIDPIFD